MARDQVNNMPCEDWMEQYGDGTIRRVVVKQGRFRQYKSDNVVIAPDAEWVEENRPEWIPKIRNWKLPEQRGVVPVGERIPLEGKGHLAFRISRIKDPNVIRQMMADDTRQAAEKIYIDRLDKIAKNAKAGIVEEDVEEEELVEA